MTKNAFGQETTLFSDKPLRTARDWHQVKLDIGELAEFHEHFFHTLCIFANPVCIWKENDYLLVESDLNEEISNNRTVHIKGNLNSDIYIGDHSELVIAGNVAKHATIYSNGISRIYIGESLEGTIYSTSSTRITIKQNFTGNVLTGQPSTFISVDGDYRGYINPIGTNGALLIVKIEGYTHSANIKELYAQAYTKISGFFRHSDIPAGIYQSDRRSSDFFTVTKTISVSD